MNRKVSNTQTQQQNQKIRSLKGEKQLPKKDLVSEKENFQMNNDDLEKSIEGWINKGASSNINNSLAVQRLNMAAPSQSKIKEPSMICDSISRINCTLKSQSNLNGTQSQKPRKKKGKKKKNQQKDQKVRNFR